MEDIIKKIEEEIERSEDYKCDLYESIHCASYDYEIEKTNAHIMGLQRAIEIIKDFNKR
jgi:hypothetical protein